MRGIRVKNLIETLLTSEGSLDKGSKIENMFEIPHQGCVRSGVENLIETLLRSEGSLDKGSKVEHAQMHPYQGCLASGCNAF